MRLQHIILLISLYISAESLSGQSNQGERLFIPFLDKESQSNVLVTVNLSGEGKSCPPECTNVLSNTNLFTLGEQKLISEAFEKYKNVTTNSWPSGTVLASLSKTNYVIKAMNRDWPVENWTAIFRYTNSDASDEIRFGGSILAKFRDNSNDGYNVSFTRTGSGTLCGFGEVKHGLPNGLFVRFDDGFAQGVTWDYKLARLTNNSLVEHRQYTNGLVFGKFLMWNPQNGNLMLQAEFKAPFDLEKHRIDLNVSSQRYSN